MKTLIAFLLTLTGFMAIAPELERSYIPPDDYEAITISKKNKADKVVSENYALISEMESLLAERKHHKYFEDHPYRTIE